MRAMLAIQPQSAVNLELFVEFVLPSIHPRVL